jgi:hypothetical protein
VLYGFAQSLCQLTDRAEAVSAVQCNVVEPVRRSEFSEFVSDLVVRQSPASKDVNTEAEEATALNAVTRRQPVNTKQTEDVLHAVVNWRVFELVIAL